MTDAFKEVGSIGNYYGGLAVKKEGDQFYWGIMDWDDDYEWQEIPESLYRELIAFAPPTRTGTEHESGKLSGKRGLAQ
jgi:hypothetical protein